MVYCFRPQRRSPDDSMKETKYFPSVDALKDHVAHSYDMSSILPGIRPTYSRKNVMLKKLSIPDTRTGWSNCAYVLIDGMIIGYYGEKNE